MLALIYPPGYQAPLANWPDARTAVPLRQCAVIGCKADKTIELRGGVECERRWCQEHAVAYDIEVMRRRSQAPVVDLFTGERVA